VSSHSFWVGPNGAALDAVLQLTVGDEATATGFALVCGADVIWTAEAANEIMPAVAKLLAPGPAPQALLTVSVDLFDHLLPGINTAAEANGLSLLSSHRVTSQSLKNNSWGTCLSADDAHVLRFGWTRPDSVSGSAQGGQSASQ